jgi:hypothetical protein
MPMRYVALRTTPRRSSRSSADTSRRSTAISTAASDEPWPTSSPETFTQAYRRRSTFEPRSEGALPWLYGIAANLVRRHRRTEVRRLKAYARTGIDESVELDETSVAERLDAGSLGPSLALALASLTAECHQPYFLSRPRDVLPRRRDVPRRRLDDVLRDVRVPPERRELRSAARARHQTGRSSRRPSGRRGSPELIQATVGRWPTASSPSAS